MKTLLLPDDLILSETANQFAISKRIELPNNGDIVENNFQCFMFMCFVVAPLGACDMA